MRAHDRSRTRDAELLRPRAERPPAAALTERLGQVSTATLTSVLLKLGLRNTFMTDVHPLVPGARLVGQAYTLRYIPMREDLDADALDGRFDNLTNPQRIGVERVGPGDVMVIDARGDIRAGTIGNILVTRMRQRGARRPGHGRRLPRRRRYRGHGAAGLLPGHARGDQRDPAPPGGRAAAGRLRRASRSSPATPWSATATA